MSAKVKTAQGTHLYRAYLITKAELVDRAQLPAKQQDMLNNHNGLGTDPLYLVSGVSVGAANALRPRTFFVNKDHMDTLGGILPSNIIFDIKVLGRDLARGKLCAQSVEVAGHLPLQQWAETLKKAQRASAPKKAPAAQSSTP